MFLRNSFSPVSFSQSSFHGAQTTFNDQAKSGYWRLFFYQMQEESLKKDKERVDIPEVISTVKPVVAKVKREIREVKKKKQVVQETKNVKLAQPAYTYALPQPAKQRPTVLDIAWQATLYVRTLVAKAQIVAVQLECDISERRKRRNRDIDLLLLLA